MSPGPIYLLCLEIISQGASNVFAVDTSQTELFYGKLWKVMRGFGKALLQISRGQRETFTVEGH